MIVEKDEVIILTAKLKLNLNTNFRENNLFMRECVTRSTFSLSFKGHV